jgi:hypothetical protein
MKGKGLPRGCWDDVPGAPTRLVPRSAQMLTFVRPPHSSAELPMELPMRISLREVPASPFVGRQIAFVVSEAMMSVRPAPR